MNLLMLVAQTDLRYLAGQTRVRAAQGLESEGDDWGQLNLKTDAAVGMAYGTAISLWCI
jgi:hypothetical protein